MPARECTWVPLEQFCKHGVEDTGHDFHGAAQEEMPQDCAQAYQCIIC